MTTAVNAALEGYISTREAAAIMGLAPEYVRRLAREGKIEAVKCGFVYLVKVPEHRRRKDGAAHE